INNRIDVLLQKYENLVGLTEVKTAQKKVIDAEQIFQNVQNERRNCQTKMTEIQNRLKDIHVRLDKLQRGDERYLILLTEEHDVLRNEKKLMQDLRHWEQAEHDHFAALSSALRESHEKERAQAEKTKYWSIIGSVIGAAIGIVGTSINNHMKMRELKDLVQEGSDKNLELKDIVKNLSQVAQAQYGQTISFLSDLQTLILEGKAPEKLKLPLLLASESEKFDNVNKVVYVGSEITNLLQRMEDDLEWKIKKNALMTTGLIYGTGLVAAAVVY
ncbi:hypothetical protein HELRODRAFT_143063, partial [Helobdella robusta]|uniref:Coiled-coil domain-containing protein 51 n=1 Tax=Helobdella robusta TaxID=6412 RepID=T1EJ89_HELRO